MKKCLPVLFLCLVFAASGQLKSPDEFLGYSIGSRFTPHFRIVNYFEYAAAQSPGRVKIIHYGETNEGRPLMLACISSPENIANLGNIQKNNLRLAHLVNDQIAPNENMPPIVWLSYNVHGNEPASSEASMLTLYALLDPANMKTKEWLKNTVVILDPCINPDGRDRYVNWYNSVVGKYSDPQPFAREHREPWPHGRTNHYNFDLNRDWAWQTQVESQQRIKIYDEWMPQVHVDYHEQGINSPYYFAPAAEPYHEVITQWQRDFQVMIGKNNAKYFDQNSWLYFTKEEFDLFYPSYGDTYPTFNGAIGMTFEQGGIGAGLGVITRDGDTLTLADRAKHHFTTSLSTIETASMNAGRLMKEFHAFFTNATEKGYGAYKTYVIKNSIADAERVRSLTELLDKNQVSYVFSPGSFRGMFSGYNYFTGKNEGFSIDQNDLVISALQPRSALLSVLFEPDSRLSDSATYDISAWSLPYAYGVKAFAVKDNIHVSEGNYINPFKDEESSYGFILPWQGIPSVKTVCTLLKKGFVLRYTTVQVETNGKQFKEGSILILKTANKKFGNDIFTVAKNIADENKVHLYAVPGGMVDRGVDFGSNKTGIMKAPRVALLTGDPVSSSAAGEVWHFMEKEIGYPVSLINATDLNASLLNNFDVLVMPDGNYKFLSAKDKLDEFRNWLNTGGRVVALESAVSQLAGADLGIKFKKQDDGDKKDTSYRSLKVFEQRDRDAISSTTPGSIWKVFLDNTNPLAYGYPDYYFTLKQDDVIYDFMKGDDVWNVGVLKKENNVAGFVGSRLKPKLKDGLLFGVQFIGRGAISFLADDVLFRNFWENGKLMFCNAVFMVQ
jgi:hypothetical protein